MNIIPRVPVRREDGMLTRRGTPFDTLQREIDRVFDSFGGFPAHAGLGFPSVDVSETDTEVKISAELPGVDEKDVHLALADDVLTIRGEKRAEHVEGDKGFRMVECAYGAFSRSLELPTHVDAAKVKAKMRHGVLKITAPKAQDGHARRIEIQPEA